MGVWQVWLVGECTCKVADGMHLEEVLETMQSLKPRGETKDSKLKALENGTRHKEREDIAIELAS